MMIFFHATETLEQCFQQVPGSVVTHSPPTYEVGGSTTDLMWESW